jgi:hypothetical protein
MIYFHCSTTCYTNMSKLSEFSSQGVGADDTAPPQLSTCLSVCAMVTDGGTGRVQMKLHLLHSPACVRAQAAWHRHRLPCMHTCHLVMSCACARVRCRARGTGVSDERVGVWRCMPVCAMVHWLGTGGQCNLVLVCLCTASYT